MEITPRQQWAIEKFNELAVKLGSANKAGEQTGVSAATMSAIKNDKYKGNVSNQLERLIAYFDTKEAASETYAVVDYAQTSISSDIYEIIRNCQIKGGLAIASGDAGIGKTKAAKQYAKDHPNDCIYISVNPCLKTSKSVLKLIGNSLGVSERALDELWIAVANKLHDGYVIIIDESQHLGIKTIESLRSLSDYFDSQGKTLGLCFVGNQETVHRLGAKQKAEFAQIANRTKQKTVYTTRQITRKDIQLLFPPIADQDPETEFLLKIAHSQQALRGATNLFSNAHDNGDVTYKGLVAMAKFMDLAI